MDALGATDSAVRRTVNAPRVRGVHGGLRHLVAAQPEPAPDAVSEIEVLFTPEGGWPGLLKRYSGAVGWNSIAQEFMQ
jgi:hypothetical protein